MAAPPPPPRPSTRHAAVSSAAYSRYAAAMAADRRTPTDDSVERIQRRLAQYVGPHTARLSLKTFAQKQFGQAPETLTAAQLPELVRALRPLVRSVLGDIGGERLLRMLLAECP
jgi:hypothetical protein